MALTIAKVLCTTDFSDLSLEGIEYALNFAKQFGAEVRILHVYGLPTYLAAPDGAIIPTATLATARSDEAQRQLDETVAKYADRGVTIDGCLRVGITHDEVVSQAQEWGAGGVAEGMRGSPMQCAFVHCEAARQRQQ